MHLHGGLVLTRRPGQTVFIGDDITVTVEAVDDRNVKLRFCAPQGVAVDREEVRARKLAEAADE